SADIIISATHIWTNRLLETVGLKLPMKAIVHQRYVTQPLETAVTIPAINANPYGAYIRPAEGGRLLAGFEIPQPSSYAVPSLDFDMTSVTTSKSYPSQLKANLTPLLPQLENTTWESEHVGLLSFSADNEPILGTLRPGLIVAGSFHSGGFAYNPVAGLLLAELALGESTSIDLRAFAPDRFSPEVTETYLATEDVHYKEGIQRRH
ncbi:MAG: FAD-binding oxidoreductase, partial [Anaerolineae bacterium]|nr:FAD-binding oxidoreductase [Anaerolineae bacterium]